LPCFNTWKTAQNQHLTFDDICTVQQGCCMRRPRKKPIWPMFFHKGDIAQRWNMLAHQLAATPNPRHSPVSATSMWLRLCIVGDLAYLRVLHPERRLDKANVSRIMKWYGVSRRHVYDSQKVIDPQLRAMLKVEAAAHAVSMRLFPADLRAIQESAGDAAMKLFQDLMT
jgi:hypothetical protein